MIATWHLFRLQTSGPIVLKDSPSERESHLAHRLRSLVRQSWGSVVNGQVEGFAAELELDPSFFEAEGAGNVLVHVEQARAAQEVSAGGPERPHGGVGEGGPVEIWGIGVVASQNLDYRVDLGDRLPLASGIRSEERRV